MWKYITLFKRIFLIDSPGVVYGNMELPTADSASTDDPSAASSLAALNNETTSVLKGVVRIDNLEEPAQYVPGVLARIKREYIVRTYGIETWESHIDFLEQYARRTGKLLKGGGEDVQTVARMVLNDWQRGRLPYFVCPPFEEEVKRAEEADEDERRKKEEERRLKVEQMYNKIAVRVKFDADDMRGPQAGLQVADEADEEEEEGEQAERKDWDKVYETTEAEDVDAEEAEKTLNINNDGEAEAEAGEEEEAGWQEEEERRRKERAKRRAEEKEEQKDEVDVVDVQDESEEQQDAVDGEDVEEMAGEVSESVVRAMNERRARYHMDADEEDDEVEEKQAADDEDKKKTSGTARRVSSAFTTSGGSSVASAEGDTRPRSKKNKNRSKKNKQHETRKRKHGWK